MASGLDPEAFFAFRGSPWRTANRYGYAKRRRIPMIFGTVVLRVTPDASSGGLLALVRTGDRMVVAVKSRPSKNLRQAVLAVLST
jgi:Dehydratase family